MLPCIVAGIFWRKVPRVPCPSRSPSVRPARSHSLPVVPARPSAAPTTRCEPFSAFPLLPGPSTRPAWPSAVSVSARCEPILAFPLLPGPSTSPARPSAASVASGCEPFPAFPLLPAPPSRTSPLCLIAKPFPEPSPNHGPVLGRDCRCEFVRLGQGHPFQTAFWPWAA